MSPERRPVSREAREHAVSVLMANRVREAREHAELTVRGLAKRLSRPHSYVVDIENHHRRIAVAELWALADATGMSVEWFVARPRDEDEQEEYDFALVEFERGGAAAPRTRDRG